ncbi:hypothetical protein SDC9_171033 [bioreactor metagenome]|uniref:Uncharacterized protein n=1 Tax=bioreactor metagenome TaxID=1076179 RepID=A0A645GC48_9ZZZZ
MTGGPIAQKAPENRPRRGVHPPRVDHQHGGGSGLPRHVPGAEPSAGAYAVVIAHGPLQQGWPAGGRKTLPEPPGRGEEGVQIAPRHPQRAAVKHGVDIVRPFLIGLNLIALTG